MHYLIVNLSADRRNAEGFIRADGRRFYFAYLCWAGGLPFGKYTSEGSIGSTRELKTVTDVQEDFCRLTEGAYLDVEWYCSRIVPTKNSRFMKHGVAGPLRSTPRRERDSRLIGFSMRLSEHLQAPHDRYVARSDEDRSRWLAYPDDWKVPVTEL